MDVKDIFSSISYEVNELLATDGWGDLYRAVYVPHGTDVLFRRFPAALAADESAWKLMVAELRAWSRLEHSGIVPVMEWGLLEGEAFLATRLPAGVRLADSEPLDESAADVDFSSLLAAMAEAAKWGVLHLGLCPGNIWIDGGVGGGVRLRAVVRRARLPGHGSAGRALPRPRAVIVFDGRLAVGRLLAGDGLPCDALRPGSGA
jgi:hypothetical protein